jgi:hypothetical protein
LSLDFKSIYDHAAGDTNEHASVADSILKKTRGAEGEDGAELRELRKEVKMKEVDAV